VTGPGNCNGEWHRRDPYAPVRARVTPDGDVRINSRVRLTPDEADSLGAWLQKTAARLRAATAAPALGAILAPGSSATGARLAGGFRAAIRAGAYAPGARLPTAATLRAAYRVTVSKPTVDKAMRLLAADGYAEFRPDTGWHVPDLLPALRDTAG
jgi:hypothetical protein